MSARRRNIDGVTGLYTVENGDYLDDGDGVQSKVILALRTRYGSCAADPELGSKIHLVPSTSAADRGLAEAYTRSALKRMVERREISRLSVNVGTTAIPGRLVIEVEYYRRAGNTESVRFETGT